MGNSNSIFTQGFTLLELLVVVAIMGITLAIGVPSLQSFIVDNRLTTSANDMLTALQAARSEATKRVKFAGVSINGNSWEVFVESQDNVVQRYKTATNISVAVEGNSNPIFRPEGRLNSVNVITMTFTSTVGSAQRTLTIAPSGKIKITNP
ncbi:general secretion pathway protein H [Methylomicrobium album BG8]|uniref:Type II secretion system protein H n=2 Tax=Methylococcaceae TaxID=403 RepID=H8GK32_METAL|nr:general secretion pathway protein H [Methylomicrobium album BG8]